ncbi:hypothetical protein [Salicibibacter cibi]|uniref:hypothetical protein n=1 Tax=Salicibibacter cibi TaxID=2743001 RepID=UPI001FEC3678|nr:hypothetical protein [Salicibibacter cibi]
MMINLKRLMETINTSAAIGATENGGLYRLTLSKEDTEMRATFVQWLETADLQVTVDDFGNIYGRREGTKPDLSP